MFCVFGLSTRASGHFPICRCYLDGCIRHSADNPHGNPVQTRFGKPVDTDLGFRKTICSPGLGFENTVNVVDCSSDLAEHRRLRCLVRGCNLVGEPPEVNCCSRIYCLDDSDRRDGIDRSDSHDRDRNPIVLVRYCWQLQGFRRTQRMPTRNHQISSSISRVCVPPLAPEFGKCHASLKMPGNPQKMCL